MESFLQNVHDDGIRNRIVFKINKVRSELKKKIETIILMYIEQIELKNLRKRKGIPFL